MQEMMDRYRILIFIILFLMLLIVPSMQAQDVATLSEHCTDAVTRAIEPAARLAIEIATGPWGEIDGKQA